MTTNSNRFMCGNCDWCGTDLDEIVDVMERVSSGELMPEGQCPDCGALVHGEIQRSTLEDCLAEAARRGMTTTAAASRPRVFLDLSGGAIHEVLASTPVDVLIIDDDLDGTGDDAPRLELPSGARAAYWHYPLTGEAGDARDLNGVDAERVAAMYDCAERALNTEEESVSDDAEPPA